MRVTTVAKIQTMDHPAATQVVTENLIIVVQWAFMFQELLVLQTLIGPDRASLFQKMLFQVLVWRFATEMQDRDKIYFIGMNTPAREDQELLFTA